ncbi:unnamed protein product, partial [marine sediment metagenome]
MDLIKPQDIDLLHGDESVVLRDDFKPLSYTEFQVWTKNILENPNISKSDKNFFIDNSWRYHYEIKPPSLEEFLSPRYIGAVA